ncbi:TetR/AcrR family transcriptional regulator [Amnibacterium kyonggiense]
MTTMRRDAVRNRERILDAARIALDAGEALQLNAVARRAEVGVGTVYRHFPTPEALGEGLVEHRFVRLLEVASAAADDRQPLAALRRFLDQALRDYADDPLFATASVSPDPARTETARLRAELLDAFGVLVRRAATHLQSGLDAGDLMVLLCGLAYSVRLRPARAGAYLDALLAGVLR